MMFAQTIVELPKYGARRREAEISVASVPQPPTSTSTESRVPLTRASAVVAVAGGTSLGSQADDDHGAVVGQVAPRKRAGIGHDLLRELLGGQGRVPGE